MPTALFHPAVTTWFTKQFGHATEPQRRAWPAIARGEHTLIAAPTGSGKTLAAFLAAIDSLVRQGVNGALGNETQVVYISPLKALSNDIEKNLQQPLAGIREELKSQGLPDVDIQVQVRTGDTTPAERAAMRKQSPHILVTTPESFYLLLTSESGRAMLETTRTVIVDEIHAIAGSKRGSHLALSLERLDALTGRRVVRVGLSATQKPIDEVARFLVGVGGSEYRSNLSLSRVPDESFALSSACPELAEGSKGERLHEPLEARSSFDRLRTNEMESVLRTNGEQSGGTTTDHKERLREENGRPNETETQKPFVVSLSNHGRLNEDDKTRSHVDPSAGSGQAELRTNELESVLRTSGMEGDGAPADCVIVDTGFTRERDLALELPGSPLEAVMAEEVWRQVYDRLAELIGAHRTTLVFVNTRRMAERVAKHLSDRLGKEHVTSHHGSMAKESRLDAEQRLKQGKLRALVATASLELGIDIGDVDLVCQLGTPRAISTFLQRVGRSGHAVTGTPKGRLFPLTRDELVECAALLDAVRQGELDRLRIPPHPLDVLAQQIVAEVAARTAASTTDESDETPSSHLAASGISEAQLYDQFRRAYPYRALTREDYTAVVRLLADGFSTRRGRRSAYLHRDAVNGVLRARAGARITALTCGGAIPDNADYKVVLEPSGLPIGTLNEDFAVESMAGDIFQLGNASYRIRKIEPGVVRVEDAQGMPPSIPFWLGEAPARTDELSLAVSRLRQAVDAQLGETVTPASLERTRSWLEHNYHLSPSAAEQITDYLASTKAVLAALPTLSTVIFERFFDETGGMQLVIHSPFGGRVNRAWGLSLRKRFCRKFNFELQAAATEDAIVLSLGETHSFPLEDVARYLHSASVRDVLVQALLDAPLFTTRWRWNVTISLAVKRFRGGKRHPAPLARMDAEDLIAVVFPDQIACAENLTREREVPDHPLVKQTIDDCLTDAMDIDGLIALLQAIERGNVRVVARDLPHPSPLSQEILNAKPYAFLDDAPLEERRTQAVMSRRWLDPLAASEFGRLDPEAIARVRAEAWPDAGNADELHDALLLLGFIEEREGKDAKWEPLLAELVRTRRATRTEIALGRYWVAAELLPAWLALHSNSTLDPEIAPPVEYARREWSPETALIELVRARLQGLGPVSSAALAASFGVTPARMDAALLALEAEGFAMRGQFTGAPAQPNDASAVQAPIIEWCERRLLARIHRYTVERLRAEIEPVTAADFLRFLFEWHGITTDTQPEGPQALATIVEQLEGYEAAAIAWEGDILPVRMHAYDPDWLDTLCRSGRTVWARLALPKTSSGRATTPVRATPITLVMRKSLRTWQTIAPSSVVDGAQLSPRAQRIADYLAQHGASFFEEIAAGTNLLKSEAEDALRELVAVGRVNADGFSGLRTLLLPSEKRRSNARRRRGGWSDMDDAGRWTLLQRATQTAPETATPDIIEQIARSLLKRYGVVSRQLLTREPDWLPSWYELLKVYRRLEARGEIRGGRFVSGFAGEQYALADAVSALRAIRKKSPKQEWVSVSAADPLNLVGVLTPGNRVPAVASNRVLYRNGVPIAVQVGGEVNFIADVAEQDAWTARNALLRPWANRVVDDSSSGMVS
jgi:ATP-dependent helicase Lhr and Lhr-like helicase